MTAARRLPCASPLARACACVLAGLAAALLSGCASGASAPDAAKAETAAGDQPRRGGTVVIGFGDREPASLNWLVTANGRTTDRAVVRPLMDPLLDLDEHGRAVGILAERVPTLANGGVRRTGPGMTVTVTLRRGVAWSDGRALTCRDIAFTWRTMMDERWLVSSRRGWRDVRSVRCPHPRRAELMFVKPYANYVDLLRSFPLPEHDLRGRDFNTYWSDDVPVGSGPFVVERWEHGARLLFRRNERYWNAGPGDLPRLDRLDLRFVETPSTLNVQLTTGEVDAVFRPLDNRLDEERSSYPRSVLASTPGNGTEQLGFNLEHAPTNDPHVRRAIAYAVDRVQLTERLLGAPFEPLQSAAPPHQSQWHEPAWERWSHDPEASAAELREAGYRRVETASDGLGGAWVDNDGKRLRVVMKVPFAKGIRIRVAELLQEQLRQQGIELRLVFETPEVFFGNTLRKGAWDLVYWASGVGIDGDLTQGFSCEPSPGARNLYRYCDERVDRMLAAATAELDTRRRARLVRAVQHELAADLPVLPLYHTWDFAVHSPRLRNIRPIPIGKLTWNVADWWVAQ